MRAAEDTLFARFQRSGSPDTLGEVYDLVAPELLHVALHLTGRPGLAEDVLQSTFLVALEKAQDYDPTRPLRPWLLGILGKQARQHRARESRQPDPERLAPTAPPRPEELAEHGELADHLDEALLSLPPAYQPVLILRLRHGLDPVEIAHALRRPPGTVRAQLSRGLERLRRSLPAGYAGAALLALAPSVRGMDAIRAAIVAEAKAQLPWTASLLGGLTVQKLALVASIAATLVLAPVVWQELQSPDRVEETARPSGLVAPAGVEGTRLAVPVERVRATPAEAHAPSTAPASVETQVVEAERGSLLVRVRDPETGGPAAEVWVLVESFAKGRSYADHLAERTDASGEARFEDLPLGRATARVLRGRQDGTSIWPGKTATLQLSLLPGFDVTGEVVDSAGHPVPHANVWLSRRWTWSDGAFVTRADAMGRFRLSHVTRDHSLGAGARGWARSMLQNPSAEDGDTAFVRIVLDRPSATVAGVVVDGGGRAVAGADVLLGSEEPAEGKRLAHGAMTFGPPPLRTRTAEDGSFAFEDAPAGSAVLQARRHGFAPGTVVVDPTAQPGDVTLVLSPEAGVRGHVRDADGRPVAAVWVHTDPRDRFASTHAWTDASGAFELKGLGRSVELVAEKHGGGQARGSFRLEPGEIATWDVVLQGVPDFRGTLVDEGGDPIEGWTVAARRGNEVVGRSNPTTADGAFVLVVPSDAPHTLLVEAPGGWRELPQTTLRNVRPSTEPLRIVVGQEGLARIAGLVLDQHGAPAAGAQVLLWHVEERLWRSYDVDADTGRIAIERVPLGTVQLQVRSEEQPWLRLDPVRLDAAETHDLGTVHLAGGRRLRGEVTGLPEALTDGLVLVVSDEDGQEAAGIEIHRGIFRSGALAPGSYLLFAQGEGVQSKSVPFVMTETGTPHLSLRLERAGVREAVFRGRRTLEPQGLWCALHDGGGNQVWMGGGRLIDGGLTVKVSARPGRYRLAGQTTNGHRIDAPFEILGWDDGGPPVEVPVIE